MMAERTPGPYYLIIHTERPIYTSTLCNAQGAIADISIWSHGIAGDPEVTSATAEFILRSCNAHDALVKALEETLEGLPSECSCHPAYREREKNLGYRFKDPECLYCDMESDIKGMLAALKLAKGDL